MLRHSLMPYYHPTTVCFVDDNQSFLDAMCLGLPPDLAYVAFNRPQEAIDFLNTPPPLTSLVSRALQVEAHSSSKQIVHLDTSLIEQEISQIDRFRRVSVLIVDYAMPRINGLQLCTYIEDHFIRRALLTGVADEKTAVEAFNARLIDRYITKTTSLAMEQLIGFVSELQLEYFAAHSERLHTHLSATSPEFMSDPKVEDFIFNFIEANRIVEYYQVGEPDGFVFVDFDGAVKRMVIASDAQMQGQLAFAQRHSAPAEIVDAIAARRVVGYFYESPEDYLGAEEYPWPEFLLETIVVNSRQTWFIGVSNEPAVDVDYDPDASSFRSFLRATAL
ncbi:MAG: response regulator [Proteobacteria bacterium]|nr:response regulator [Pseudomonadota bacterium]